MPGTNHDIDATFLDNLPLAVRDAALDMLRYTSLKELVEYRLHGPSEYIVSKHNLSDIQWEITTNAVILAKVSYFDIELHFPNRYIDKLIEIAAFAANLPTSDPMSLYDDMLLEHPKFAGWIKKAIQVKQQNIRFASISSEV